MKSRQRLKERFRPRFEQRRMRHCLKSKIYPARSQSNAKFKIPWLHHEQESRELELLYLLLCENSLTPL